MDEEKLILLVRSQEHIYNRSLHDYKVISKKKEAWENIAQVMGHSEEHCMKRWTSLRDRYVREKRQVDKDYDSGSSSCTKYRFPHMDSMEFLDPHIATRPNRSSQNIKYKPRVSFPITVEIATPPIESAPSYSPLLSPIEPSPPTDPEPTTEPEVNLTKKRKRNSVETTETAKMFNEAVEAFKKVCKSREETPKEETEPLYSFGKMIMATIGSLSVMKQVKAMQQVTDVVMKIKMETQTEFNGFIFSED